MIRELGWQRNRGEQPLSAPLVLKHKAEMPLAPLATPDVGQFCGPLEDQGRAGSCVAFAGGLQLGLFFRAMGMTEDWIFPSPLFGYPQARLQEWAGINPNHIPKLRDDGSQPALYLQAVRRMGFVPWDIYPYPRDITTLSSKRKMEELVNRVPPPSVSVQAWSQKGMEFAIYEGPARGRTDWIEDCLVHRMAPTFGMMVDQKFMENSGELVKNVDLPNNLGGHDQCIIALDHAGNAIVAGSWGPSFGSQGIVVVSRDVINDPDICSDFQIVKAAPLP